MNAPIIDSGRPRSVATARRMREPSEPEKAVSIPANIARMAQMTHELVTICRDVQLHRVHCHADERARERRAVIGVEYRPLIVGPVRITRGELDGLPETLKRIDCCITLGIMVLQHWQTKKRLPFRCCKTIMPTPEGDIKFSEW